MGHCGTQIITPSDTLSYVGDLAWMMPCSWCIIESDSYYKHSGITLTQGDSPQSAQHCTPVSILGREEGK